MSKNIPTVRPWRVKFYVGPRVVETFTVVAPTKLFAKWAAMEKTSVYHLAERFTISLARHTAR